MHKARDWESEWVYCHKSYSKCIQNTWINLLENGQAYEQILQPFHMLLIMQTHRC